MKTQRKKGKTRGEKLKNQEGSLHNNLLFDTIEKENISKEKKEKQNQVMNFAKPNHIQYFLRRTKIENL